ncbi:MAG: RsmB/NOP family class I SAM-dependent RNA methyltransferase [Verrucomicrobiota bacterium]|nr:RsmB/NOP family class I SAM-dependent RNA methyltransferase [Verrucomicrobiota bacterium]
MQKSFCQHHIERFFGRFAWDMPLDLALSRYFKENKALGSKDRKEVGSVIYDMVRWKSLLDWEVGEHSSWHERLSLYQSERFSRLRETSSVPEAVRIGVPEWLLRRLIVRFGADRGREIARILNSEAPLTVRANSAKTTREQLFSLWKEHYSIQFCKMAPHGIQFAKREPLFTLPEFKEGLFEVQDEGSQLVAQEVGAKPGHLVLDFCSGSGGKTLGFAPAMEGKGQIFLHDIRPRLLIEAKKRLRRAGIQNGQFLSPDHPQLKKLKGRCDWVLIDVPCSGTGTLRRNPDQKWRLQESDIERFVSLQRTIAEEALLYLKPGGHLVYATCSLLKEENEDQIDWLLSQKTLTLVKPPLLLAPEQGGMDGFFSACLRMPPSKNIPTDLYCTP